MAEFDPKQMPDPKQVMDIMHKLQNDPQFLAAIERALGTGGPTQAGGHPAPHEMLARIEPANAAALVIAFV